MALQADPKTEHSFSILTRKESSYWEVFHRVGESARNGDHFVETVDLRNRHGIRGSFSDEEAGIKKSESTRRFRRESMPNGKEVLLSWTGPSTRFINLTRGSVQRRRSWHGKNLHEGRFS